MTDKIYACLIGGLIGDAMGAPVEGWHFKKIEKELGEVSDFKGEGTDDSAIKEILCKALIKNQGYAGPDEFAESFLDSEDKYNLFFIPVKNMFHKIKDNICLPEEAGRGNMQSSSSAMAISPIGLVNACNPRQAALEACRAAALIHSGRTGFCRDAAGAIAAAVAEAMSPAATVNSVLEASVKYLNKKSGAEMIENIKKALKLARLSKSYRKFRESFYRSMLRDVICDSRETVPAALAVFYLAGGNAEKAVIYGANFGRDADTIATMAGAIAGAFCGTKGLRKSWVEKIKAGGGKQEKLARELSAVARKRLADANEVLKLAGRLL